MEKRIIWIRSKLLILTGFVFISFTSLGQPDSSLLLHAKYYSIFHKEHAITNIYEQRIKFTKAEFLKSNGFNSKVVFVRTRSVNPYSMCLHIIRLYLGAEQVKSFNQYIDNDSFEIVEPVFFNKLKEQYKPDAESWFDLIPDSLTGSNEFPTLCTHVISYAQPFNKIYKLRGFVENDFNSFYEDVMLNEEYMDHSFHDYEKKAQKRVGRLEVSGLHLQELYKNRKRIKRGKYYKDVCQEVIRH